MCNALEVNDSVEVFPCVRYFGPFFMRCEGILAGAFIAAVTSFQKVHRLQRLLERNRNNYYE